MTVTSTEIGAAVAELRKGLGMTQAQVAKEFCARGINKDSGQISRMEAGKMSISAIQLYTLADIFGLTLDCFDPKRIRQRRISDLKRELAELQAHDS